MSERTALTVAGALHIALFAALSLGWASLPAPPPMEEAIPVELVAIAPRTQVTERPKPSKAAAPQETAAPEPAPEAKPEPPKPAPEPVPEPTPEPKPDKVAETPKPPKLVKVEPKPAKAEAKPVAKPLAKPVERLDTAELSSLIDKSLPKAPKKVRDPDDFAKAIALSIPKSAKLDSRATASLAAAIRAQIAPCWNPPIGGADVRKMTVVLSITLGRDGSVVGRPNVVSQTGATLGNSGYAKAFADTAVRAVLRCAPLKLPPEMFDAWKAFELNFDPSEMT